MRRLINFCWWSFRWGLALLVIAALLGGGYLYFRLDEEIRRYAQHEVARCYQAMDVKVGGARFVPGRGVAIFDVSLGERDALGMPAADGPVLRIAELNLVGRFELRQFIEGQPVVDRIVVRRPRLALTRHSDGRWNFEGLMTPPESKGPTPPLQVIDATLVVDDQTRPQGQPFVLRNADLTVERLTDAGPKTFRFKGEAIDSLAKQIKVAGQVDLKSGACQFTANADGLRVTHEMLAAAPGAPVELLGDLKIQALASVRLNASRVAKGAAWDWSASFAVREGAFQHAALPRNIRDLEVDGMCDPAGLTIRNCSCKCGATDITAVCNRRGWEVNSPIALRARVTGLPLDERLRAALPAAFDKHWRRARPTGMVDVAATATFDGIRWRPDVTIDCRDLSFEDAKKFPYRLNGGRGWIRYTDSGETSGGRVEVKISAQAEGRPVSLKADIRGFDTPAKFASNSREGLPKKKPVGWAEFNGPQMRVSEKLIAALSPHPQALKLARQMSPTGEFGASWRLENRSPDQPHPDIAIELVAKDCAIRYDLFPYPLEHIQGRIQGRIRGREHVWSFDQFESREINGPRTVTASGSVQPVDGRMTFKMLLTAIAAPLDESLKQALPASYQQFWTSLQPRGRVSFAADVGYTVGDTRPTIDIDLTPYGRSVSIEPTFFPYRLDRVDGRFRMSGGQLQFSGGRAEHGRTRFASNGSWTPIASGGWRFQLDRLHVDYLDADHDLRLAAPLALRRIIDGLQPEGSFGVNNGQLAFTHNPADPAGLRAEWNVELDCHHANMMLGVPIEGISGSLQIAGISHGANNQAYGLMNLDTAFWNGLQVTDVRGPFWADQTECRVGRGVAERVPTAPPVEATARAYGGSATMNARALLGSRTQYAMAIGARDVDFDRFAHDYLNLQIPVPGRVDAQVNLNGAGASIHGLQGSGTVQMREANLYQLPQMVALLKALRGRTPDTVAFDGGDAEFTIQGKHLQFSRLDLSGDAISLYGRGEASFDKDVDLTFHSIVGRNAPSIPFVRSLVGQASEQLLRLRAVGTLDQPDIRLETLSMVGEVLDQFRADRGASPLTEPAKVPRAAALRRQER